MRKQVQKVVLALVRGGQKLTQVHLMPMPRESEDKGEKNAVGEKDQ